MFTDVYIGLVKSEKFDYDKEGNYNGYSPSHALPSLHPSKKPALAGERDIFWDILGHPQSKKTDWGCSVVKMTAHEMVEYLSQPKYSDNEYAKYMISEIKQHLDLHCEYLLTAMES